MSVLTNIQDFWERFEQVQDPLLKALKERDYTAISEIVKGLDEECYAISGAHFFVEDNYEIPEMTIDSGPNKTTQLIAAKMKDLAPKSVTDIWHINDMLAPLSQKAIEAVLQIKDESYTLADMTVFYEIDEKAEQFALWVYCPGFALIDNPEYKREMCIYLVELAIGQKTFEAYVNFVDFINAPENGKDFCNLTELYEIIETAAEKYHWKQYDSALDIYTVYKPHQEIGSDSLRKDMKIIFTTHPLLAEESLGAGKDVLMDLKAKDGEYGYIYYSNPYSGKDDALFRQELSKKIGEAVAPFHCAKVIGGAIGKSYSYIDLIVYDASLFGRIFKQIQEQTSNLVDLHYRRFEEDH